MSIAERDAGGMSFTNAARQLLADAVEEAGRLHHAYVGTEHLALALARPPNGPTGESFLDIDGAIWDRVRTRIGETVYSGRADPTASRGLPYTSRTKRVFRLAGECARELGHPRVGMPHLLLALVRERLGIGAQVLAEQGITEEQALRLAQRPDADGTTP